MGIKKKRGMSVTLPLFISMDGFAILQLVVRFGEDDGGTKTTCLVGCHLRIGHNDNHIIGLHQACSCAIEAYLTFATLALDDVGNEAFTVVIVYDVYLFAFEHPCRIHQIFVNGDATHVVEVGLGDAGAMYL